MQHIVIYGNPMSGFRFVGPFETIDDARRYIEMEDDSRNFWLAELDAPASDNGEPE